MIFVACTRSSAPSTAAPPCGSMPTAPFPKADACSFASSLDPSGIELFEQPCRAEDWDANAHVAKVSTVPVMLDEPICELADVKRASTIPNVGFCKLKLKRFGGLDLLREALDAVSGAGMESVLGDGLSSELGCWMEACVARVTIRNAGEFNGFLKPKVRLFAEPLHFTAGELVIPPGSGRQIDPVCWPPTRSPASDLRRRRRWAAFHHINLALQRRTFQAVANRVSIKRRQYKPRMTP